jgi:predicted MFS family arabinose efflux permease
VPSPGVLLSEEADGPKQEMTYLPKRQAAAVFLIFATAYFLSTLIRAVTATLAPTLNAEFDLSARDLGLLAGGYFFGFALTQIPLGTWLDRFGPKKVILSFLCVAVLGCIAFATARGFLWLLLARVLCGIGVSACLMAPLTGYRRWFEPSALMSANAWMLMVGALGMVASTLPVQWLLEYVSWRQLFGGLGVGVAGSMLMIYSKAPNWSTTSATNKEMNGKANENEQQGYGEIWRAPVFRRMAPIGFINYGGMVAMQTLWVGPWMVKVAGYTPTQAAGGLFWINVALLFAFMAWGTMINWLAKRCWSVEKLLVAMVPIAILMLVLIALNSEENSQWVVVTWVMYCLVSTVGAQVQPSVGMAFRSELAGRALSAFNLVIFAGVFCVQWGTGLLIDAFQWGGFTERESYKYALGVYAFTCAATYVHFLAAKKT